MIPRTMRVVGMAIAFVASGVVYRALSDPLPGAPWPLWAWVVEFVMIFMGGWLVGCAAGMNRPDLP